MASLNYRAQHSHLRRKASAAKSILAPMSILSSSSSALVVERLDRQTVHSHTYTFRFHLYKYIYLFALTPA